MESTTAIACFSIPRIAIVVFRSNPPIIIETNKTTKSANGMMDNPTFDSMIGYKTHFFNNLGWFGANCDKILNYVPARITGLVMILGAMILGINWKSSYTIMRRDGSKTSSPNAGYPMAALAGALGTRFEKIDHYTLGDGNIELTKSQIKSAIALMKVTTILFCGLVTIPIIITLSYLGWWIHA